MEAGLFFGGVVLALCIVLGNWYIKLLGERHAQKRVRLNEEKATSGITKKREIILDGLTINESREAVVYENNPKVPRKRKAAMSLFHREVLFGSEWIPEKELTKGTVFLGASETGKTTMMEFLMRDAFEYVGKINPGTGRPYPHRGIVLDPKGNNVALLEKMGVPYKVVNPLVRHEKCVEWNLGGEIEQDWRLIGQLVADLYPSEGDAKNEFWLNAVRGVAQTVLTAFSRREKETGRPWSFRDFYIVMLIPDLLIHLVDERDLESQKVITDYLLARVAPDVRSSIMAKTQKFAVLANEWDGTLESFSIAEWLQGDYVLVLPFDTRQRELFSTIFSLFLNKVLDCTCSLSVPDTDKAEYLEEGEVPSRFYLFLDEIQNLHKIDLLPSSANLGRAKGLSVVLCLQQLAAIEKLYGKTGLIELLSGASNQAIYAIDCFTAEDVERWFSERSIELETASRAFTSSVQEDSMSNSHSTNSQLNRFQEKVFSSSRLQSLPPSEFLTDERGRVIGGRGISGLYRSRGVWTKNQTPATWIDAYQPKKCKKTLREWTRLHATSEVPERRLITEEDLFRIFPEFPRKKIQSLLDTLLADIRAARKFFEEEEDILATLPEVGTAWGRRRRRSPEDVENL